jgi:hypothetical protein
MRYRNRKQPLPRNIDNHNRRPHFSRPDPSNPIHPTDPPTAPKLTPPPLPAHTGKGYATEALRAFIPALFAHLSSPSLSSSTNPPLNYIQAETDQDNLASQNVLRKCGFEFVGRLAGAFDSPVLGVRDTVVYRIARPGTKLAGVGGEEDDEFVPPIQ